MKMVTFVAAITLFCCSVAGATESKLKVREKEPLAACNRAAAKFSEYLKEKSYFSGASCQILVIDGHLEVGLAMLPIDIWGDSVANYYRRKQILQLELTPIWAKYFTAETKLEPDQAPPLCVLREDSCEPA